MKRIKNSLFLVLFLLICPFSLIAQENKKQEPEVVDKTVIKVMSGHKFKVPEDLPIVKKHGSRSIEPMPVYEYIDLKYTKLEIRLKAIEEVLKKLEDQINLIKEDMQSLKKEDFLQK